MIKIETILNHLSNHKDINAYDVRDTLNSSSQLYFVKEKLETNRFVDTETLTITLYVDHKEYRGSSSFVVTSADDETSLEYKIDSAVSKALKSCNKYYPLAKKSENITALKTVDNNEILKTAVKEIFGANKKKNTSLNATELFADSKKVRFINSLGIDHTITKHSLFVESIPSYKDENGEYELYYASSNSDINCKGLKEEIEDALNNVVYRANAQTLKEFEVAKDTKVYIEGEMLAMLMEAIANELSYRNQYEKSSHYSLEDLISNNPFTLVMKGEIDGAVASSPIDDSGIVLKDKEIIKDGKACALWGGVRYAYYMNQEATGSYPCIELEDYKGQDNDNVRLIILNFSSPQFDQSTGYFGGEVRLALYIDHDKVTPLSGFSISGNLYEAMKTVSFSKEEAIVNSDESKAFKGPKYLIFDSITLQK